ncbi:MAG: DUF4159 domain-containing protein [Phycisphaerae bacterium]
MNSRLHKKLIWLPLIWGLMVVLLPAGAARSDVTAEQVSTAVSKGIGHLRKFSDRGKNLKNAGRGYYQQGQVGLAALALLNAGVSANDPDVLKMIDFLKDLPNEYTYLVSVKCQVFAAADPEKYRKEIEDCAKWLIKSQVTGAGGRGMWTYKNPNENKRYRGRGDNSNTQFALLALHEASKVGVKIPPQVWKYSRLHFESTQEQDGGWAYYFQQNARIRAVRNRGGKTPSYGSMTAAGIASLYICGQQLHVGGEKQFVDGAYPGCGRYMQNEVLADGLAWMAENFSVKDNPGRGNSWHHYYLYGMERVGMISGLTHFGKHDWYRKGAEHLVKTQNKNGSWGRSTVYAHDTAFAVMFLAKGNRPVLIQKLQWKHPTRQNEWNRNIHDLENLTAFIDDKLGKKVTWQTASLQQSVQELRRSPILFVTGHDFPNFNEGDVQKLRRYAETGGTLLFEACCGREDFRKGFRAFAARAFPEYKLRDLDPREHPVYRSHYPLGTDYQLQGIDVGCRTGVIFSPNALAVLWELETIPKHSEFAFRLGTNIAAYATGRETLRDKLVEVELPAAADKQQKTEVPRGAVRVARLVHSGDYDADPRALINLAGLLRNKAKVDIVAKQRALPADDPQIYEYPVVFMTGHYGFTFNKKEVDALRTYLEKGGFLMAESCCGREEFDKSFRALIAQLFPDEKFEKLPKTHPILSGKVGRKLGTLRYRQILARELKSKGTDHPPLEAITLDGRTTVVYSKYDYSCALEGDSPYSSKGYVDEDGKNLALNIILYAISY